MENETKERAPSSKSTGTALVAKVIGIASIFLALSIPVIGLLLAITAIVLGGISLNSQKRSAAVTAITTGTVAIFLALLMFFVPILYAGIQQRAEQTQLENAKRTQPGE